MWPNQMLEMLRNKHHTSDPFELCEILNIIVTPWNLANDTNGFYKYVRRNRFIFYNSNLSDYQVKYVVAHELGHAVLHTRLNATFTKSIHWSNLSKIEVEAHQFAVNLLLSEIELDKFETKRDICLFSGIPIEMERFINL
ncbi:TPA: ImmA/IrrE family metallo-endopeptidase [Listeria monocytogenes]|uniref:Lin1233 protein n=1 Tax=Listeria innocua serovar 6a (strain ATCC BAA-680 / CLIP 11262) TaxID=272626 RepID=Q92CD9_LISIN|nr:MULTISPECIES: ImmA/IrrE family metallo-endopeptidase [Listeria]EAE5608329.1 ImmA/IrrE family metallo-endopeptidase [Listeria monocytogenes]EAE9977205.1 ImmA/IrrE family metallo-endopeptidase [Listeria monocytogenes]EAE9987833.1 ImmA/IrrE family metallo-endopeptidase [Listeria monocytogenes]EAE9989519.1 ImmA/IrrE family metallo-endopeptidase [Listeria monocytogenes]EAE9992022.1 ImmA/IrrE family metallo-endopeptidase [Listeria monocytogenes]